jgi:hypothetical protein
MAPRTTQATCDMPDDHAITPYTTRFIWQITSATSVEEIRGHTRLMAIHLRLRRAQGVLTVNFPALAPGGPL